MHHRLATYITTLIGLVLLASACPVAAAPAPLRIGYYAQGSFGEAAKEDTAMALSLWGREVSADLGVAVQPKAMSYPDAQSLVAAGASGDIDVVCLDHYSYLTMKQCAVLIPALVPVVGGEVTTTYVLLVRFKESIRSLKQLKRGVVDLGTRGVQVMPRIWLDTVLGQSKLASATAFFRSVRSAGSASKAIMNVFFGSADACIVSRRAFASACELNPQLGRQLVAFKTSESYVEECMLFSPHYPKGKAKAVRAAALAMHNSTRGRQILGLFGLDRIAPFQKGYLRTSRELIRAYREVRREQE